MRDGPMMLQPRLFTRGSMEETIGSSGGAIAPINSGVRRPKAEASELKIHDQNLGIISSKIITIKILTDINYKHSVLTK